MERTSQARRLRIAPPAAQKAEMAARSAAARMAPMDWRRPAP